MKFENELEKKAFEYICTIASDELSRRGCNDLEEQERQTFKNETVISTDEHGKKFRRKIAYDTDIIEWLNERITN